MDTGHCTKKQEPQKENEDSIAGSFNKLLVNQDYAG